MPKKKLLIYCTVQKVIPVAQAKMLLNLLSNFLNQLVALISHLFLINEMLKLLQYLLQKRPLEGVLKNGCPWNSKIS